MKQIYLYLCDPLFQAQWDRTQSTSLEFFSERTSSIQWNVNLKDQPLYEVCLIRIKEQISEKRSTACSHIYADCLLKNTSTKHNKYVVNQKLGHVDDISFRERFSRIRVFCLQNKICPFLAQGICIYFGHFYLWNTVGPNPLICLSVQSEEQLCNNVCQ